MTDSRSWLPHADISVIKRRASLYQQIREFMSARNVLEVDTPVLSRFAVSDPYIESVQAISQSTGQERLYLHTSPEYCMKRLLAARTGDIYQIAHVFRDEEVGCNHSMEFTMLEWYRTGFDHQQLMDEVVSLLTDLGLDPPDMLSYQQAFLQTVGINPHLAGNEELQQMARDHGWEEASADRHELLDFIFSSLVINKLKSKKSLIIYDYPVCMAALAKIRQDKPAVSERFEVFVDGIELANGFNELTDVEEQRQRFNNDLQKRTAQDKHLPPVDENFLAALSSGLPSCAGVAIGLDRLLMALMQKDKIDSVNAFNLNNN